MFTVTIMSNVVVTTCYILISWPLCRYFYNWGYLYPDSGSVFIAVDDCTRENGCLQVLRGSHLMGRVDHKVVGKQLQADLERVEEVSYKR